MSDPAPPSADTDRGDTDTWPWRCLECGVTIYHDGECCRDCDASSRPTTSAGEARESEGFLDWMQGQPVSTFVLKVSVLSGVELALTTLWLRAALHRSLELTSLLPGIA